MIALADVAVTVSNAKTTADWWVEKVGFGTTTLGGPGGHAVVVAPPGDRFILHLCEGQGPVEPGNTGIAFVTDEIDALVERMVRAGVEFPEALHAGPWGARAKFADPDGNVFWLIKAPGPFIEKTLALKAAAPPAASTTAKP